MKKLTKKIKRKTVPEKVMTLARAFLKMRDEFFAKIATIGGEDVAILNEIEIIILSDNSHNHNHLTFFLNALCHSSRRRMNLLKDRLDERNPKLFEKLVELGFKDKLLKIGR